jgi:hypothetical protein
LVADYGPGASLARQAVAHSITRGFAFDREVKLPAAAGGMECHLLGSRYSGSGYGSANEHADEMRIEYTRRVLGELVVHCHLEGIIHSPARGDSHPMTFSKGSRRNFTLASRRL